MVRLSPGHAGERRDGGRGVTRGEARARGAVRRSWSCWMGGRRGEKEGGRGREGEGEERGPQRPQRSPQPGGRSALRRGARRCARASSAEPPRVVPPRGRPCAHGGAGLGSGGPVPCPRTPATAGGGGGCTRTRSHVPGHTRARGGRTGTWSPATSRAHGRRDIRAGAPALWASRPKFGGNHPPTGRGQGAQPRPRPRPPERLQVPPRPLAPGTLVPIPPRVPVPSLALARAPSPPRGP